MLKSRGAIRATAEGAADHERRLRWAWMSLSTMDAASEIWGFWEWVRLAIVGAMSATRARKESELEIEGRTRCSRRRSVIVNGSKLWSKSVESRSPARCCVMN